MKARVHRLSATGPDDTGELQRLIGEEKIIAQNIVAILGKTEGNGCVNDFTRAFATQSFRQLLAAQLNLTPAEIEQRIALVMSGGTEGGLSPHWLVFEVDRSSDESRPATAKSLAIGTAFTDVFLPERIGRTAQIEATANAVRKAMQQAQLDDPADVHYVQIKCPLLTGPRIADAVARGYNVVTHDTYESMGYSRGASALGVALALGEIDHDVLSDAAIAAVLAKAEAARNGRIRGNRHIMLDDSDIHASRHARAFVGGVLAGRFGDTRLFVSGGAEHQGPDGGGPLALIVNTAASTD